MHAHWIRTSAVVRTVLYVSMSYARYNFNPSSQLAVVPARWRDVYFSKNDNRFPTKRHASSLSPFLLPSLNGFIVFDRIAEYPLLPSPHPRAPVPLTVQPVRTSGVYVIPLSPGLMADPSVAMKPNVAVATPLTHPTTGLGASESASSSAISADNCLPL